MRPSFTSRTDNNLAIRKISVSDKNTIVEFIYTRSQSNGIYILLNPPNSTGAYYILADNGKKYNLISTDGIGNRDGVTAAEYNRPVFFTAVFEPIPVHVLKIDLIEGSLNSWNFYGINLSTPIPNTSYKTITTPSINNSANSASNSAVINSVTTNSSKIWSEERLKKYWAETTPDNLEGLYRREQKRKLYNKYNYCTANESNIDPDIYYIIKDGESFILGVIGETEPFGIISLSQDRMNAFLDVELDKLGVPDMSGSRTIKLNKFTANELRYDDYKVSLPGGNDIAYISDIFTLIYKPAITTPEKYEKKETISGSGFAISSDGLIVTNHHVVEGATSITIKGINGDFSRSYKAKIVTDDANNDLAILKIDDLSFTSLGTIPYLINRKSSDVGNSIFVMGYPLRATMGDELKLTNGIISSKSGFQGDVTTYQISAPVQPGNSGGPVFDSNGNLIGIINARHKGAENATYAIKSSYLINLFDLMDKPPALPVTSKTLGKQLSEQVKIIKNFTYIIEVN